MWEGRMGGEVRDIHGNQGDGIRAQGWKILESFGVGSVDALKEYFGQTEKKVADYLASLSPEDLDKQVPSMMGDGTVPLANIVPGPGERGDGARGADRPICEGCTRGWGGFTRLT